MPSTARNPSNAGDPIGSLTDIAGYFVCDKDFLTLSSSNEQMEQVSDLSSRIMDLALEIGKLGTFGSLDKFSIYDDDSQVCVFSLNAQRGLLQPVQRIYGLKVMAPVEIHSKVQELADLV